MNRDFKGIWIARELWERKDMSFSKKIIIMEIDSLDSGKGCWASNSHFSDLIGLSVHTIKNLISEMVVSGMIVAEYINNRRILKLANSTNTAKIDSGCPEKSTLVSQNRDAIKESNTVNNTTTCLPSQTPITGKALWGNCKHDLQRFMSYYVRRFNTPLYESGTKEQRDGFYKQYTHFFKVLLDTAGTLDIACQALDNADSYYRSLNLNWGMKTLNTNWSEFVSKTIEMRR